MRRPHRERLRAGLVRAACRAVGGAVASRPGVRERPGGGRRRANLERRGVPGRKPQRRQRSRRRSAAVPCREAPVPRDLGSRRRSARSVHDAPSRPLRGRHRRADRRVAASGNRSRRRGHRLHRAVERRRTPEVRPDRQAGLGHRRAGRGVGGRRRGGGRRSSGVLRAGHRERLPRAARQGPRPAVRFAGRLSGVRNDRRETEDRVEVPAENVVSRRHDRCRPPVLGGRRAVRQPQRPAQCRRHPGLALHAAPGDLPAVQRGGHRRHPPATARCPNHHGGRPLAERRRHCGGAHRCGFRPRRAGAQVRGSPRAGRPRCMWNSRPFWSRGRPAASCGARTATTTATRVCGFSGVARRGRPTRCQHKWSGSRPR